MNRFWLIIILVLAFSCGRGGERLQVNVGDEVITSGLGSMFPQGIYIGTVEKIESDKYNLSKTIYIKTYQNFNDIHYVTVLKEKK